MTVSMGEVWDIRACAQKLQQLLKWQEEGAVVEHWTENFTLCRDLSRLALGIYIKEMWHNELERQIAFRQVTPISLKNGCPPPPAQTCLRIVGSIAIMDPSAFPWT
jgi:hypothetical protein